MTYGPQYHLWNVGTLQLSMTCMVPPIPYLECGNLVTVNNLWSPQTLYVMQEPCNGVPHMYDMICFLEPCKCQ